MREARGTGRQWNNGAAMQWQAGDAPRSKKRRCCPVRQAKQREQERCPRGPIGHGGELPLLVCIATTTAAAAAALE